MGEGFLSFLFFVFMRRVWICRLFPSNATATDLDRKTLNSTVYSLGKAVAMLLGTNTDFLTPTASVVYAHCECNVVLLLYLLCMY